MLGGGKGGRGSFPGTFAGGMSVFGVLVCGGLGGGGGGGFARTAVSKTTASLPVPGSAWRRRLPSASRRWFGESPSISKLVMSSASAVAGDGEESGGCWAAQSFGSLKSGASELVSDGEEYPFPNFTACCHIVLRRWTLRGVSS